MDKRKKVTDFIVKAVEKIIPADKVNGKMLREFLDGMSLEAFEDYIRGFDRRLIPGEGRKRSVIPYYLPNLSKHRVNIGHMFKLMDSIGHKPEQRLVMTDPNTGLRYVTPHEYLIVDLPIRRQSQTVSKKNSIPVGTQNTDELTHQPTNQSKGSRISRPEMSSLLARGLDKTIYETMNVRGGNETARREFRRQLISTGTGSLASLRGVGSVRSLETLSVFYNCMHIGNNVLPETRVPENALPRHR